MISVLALRWMAVICSSQLTMKLVCSCFLLSAQGLSLLTNTFLRSKFAPLLPLQLSPSFPSPPPPPPPPPIPPPPPPNNLTPPPPTHPPTPTPPPFHSLLTPFQQHNPPHTHTHTHTHTPPSVCFVCKCVCQLAQSWERPVTKPWLEASQSQSSFGFSIWIIHTSCWINTFVAVGF